MMDNETTETNRARAMERAELLRRVVDLQAQVSRLLVELVADIDDDDLGARPARQR